MAVIITDMDMPNRCDECDLVFEDVEGLLRCPYTMFDVYSDTVDKSCPLKSADELIDEIETAYKSKRRTIFENILKEDILEIIHKYTKEQTNE